MKVDDARNSDVLPGDCDVSNVKAVNSEHPIDRHLLAGLARAVNWLDNSLQNVRAANGNKPVHRTQSLILVHIARGVDRPTDIAREMGLTRQNVHHMAKELISQGLIEQHPDPEDSRRSQYRLAASAAHERDLALNTLAALEALLMQRLDLSAEQMGIFRKILAADWGPEITTHEELEGCLGHSAMADKPADH